MQPGKQKRQRQIRSSVIHSGEAGPDSFINNNDLHLVFITDEKGIQKTFNLLKKRLSESTNNFLTLIYCIPKMQNHPLYNDELKILESRFSQQLKVFYISKETNSVCKNIIAGLTVLEIIINSNVKAVMKFLINGKEELIEVMSEQLYFLGIEKNQIITQIS